MKKIAWVLAAVLAIALLCSAAFAEGASLTVQGAGVVFVDADRATISLGVRETGTQLADVQSLVNEKMDSVIAALKDKGVSMEDISTNTIGIYPNYDYSTDVELIVGYTAYNSLYVTISDVENAGAYIDAAFAAGANNLDNVTFFASDTTEAGRQALTLAVENAHARHVRPGRGRRCRHPGHRFPAAGERGGERHVRIGCGRITVRGCGSARRTSAKKRE